MFYKRHHKGGPRQRQCEGSIPRLAPRNSGKTAFFLHISSLPFPLFFFLFVADQLESKRGEFLNSKCDFCDQKEDVFTKFPSLLVFSLSHWNGGELLCWWHEDCPRVHLPCWGAPKPSGVDQTLLAATGQSGWKFSLVTKLIPGNAKEKKANWI